ncbi:MAG: PEP-CTERM sorting domain-containing protein [Pseudomonadota bacterium]
MTRIKRIALTLIVALALPQMASAMFVYNVDRGIGDGSVTGTITTNGNQGLLDITDILDWDFLIASPGIGGGSTTVNSGNSSLIVDFNGTGITATLDALFFDFSAADTGFFFGNTTSIAWCVFEDACYGTGGPAEGIFDGSSPIELAGGQGITTIATRVPAPGALFLLGLGLMGVALGRKPAAT